MQFNKMKKNPKKPQTQNQRTQKPPTKQCKKKN